MSQEIAVVTPSPEEEQGGLIQIVQLPIIKERLHKLKGYVDLQVAEAMAMVCTEETVTEVKKIRAELSRVFKEAEEQRRAVKMAVMQPYLEFEDVYKTCISDAFKNADADLRDKIVSVESEMKERCESGLREFFYEYAEANGISFLKYEQAGVVVSMADAKAKTQPPKKLKDQIENFILQVCMDVDMILNLEDAPEILTEYKQTLNASLAISTVTERHRKIEAATAEQEQRNAVKEQETEAARRFEAFAPPVVEVPEPEADILTCTFTINDTRARLKLLKNWLDVNGYKYT